MALFEFRILTDDKNVSFEEARQQGLAAPWAAIHMNVMYFRRKPDDICALACGKIKYDSKTKDILAMISEISTVPVLIKRGIGLCIDIVAFDVAAKLYEGREVWPHIFHKAGGIFHVATQGRDSNGNVIEYDPSSELEERGLVLSNQPTSCRICS